MVETSDLEAYITTTFTKITDEYNRPLNIGVAAPTLLDVIKGNTEQYANHKYNYIGETATNFVISLILTKQYPKFNKQALAALAKKFTSLTRLHKVINQEIHLKDHVLGPYLSDTLNSIIGFYGVNVVEKFIKSAVIHTASLELNEVVPAKPKEQMTNPIYLLQQMINSGKGQFDTAATPLSGMWCVKVICRLTEQSTLFSHARNAPSKQKAKTEAAQDVLNYLDENPTLFEQLKAPATTPEEYVLPITPDMFSQVSYATSRQSSTTSVTPNEWSDTNSAHITAEDNEETLQRLSELLLGTGAQQQQQQDSNYKKRPRQNLFSAAPVVDQEMTPVSYIKQEEEYKPFNRVPEEINTNDRVVSFFKQYFDKNRSLLSSCKLNPGQSKSILLSLVVPQQDVLHVDVTTAQAGSSHQPLFHAEVMLKSKMKPHLFLKTEGLAQKKRDAEQAAFKKLVDLITQ